VNLANSVSSTSCAFRAVSAYANNVQGKGKVLQVARVTKCSGDDTRTHRAWQFIGVCCLTYESRSHTRQSFSPSSKTIT